MVERISIDNLTYSPGMELILLTHIKSYELVVKEAEKSIVLDYGCGEGYGAALLAEKAKHVVAVDVDEKTIQEARSKFKKPNLDYICIDSKKPLNTQLKDKFDIITSFQVIEHIEDDSKFLCDLNGLLNETGKIFLTTPNAQTRLLPFQNPWNEFHIREYTFDSMNILLKKFFNNYKIQGISASEDLLKIEEKRVRKNKWLLWPVTNKLIPLKLRVFFLKIIKKLTKADSNKKSMVYKRELLTKNISLTDSIDKCCPNFYITVNNYT